MFDLLIFFTGDVDISDILIHENLRGDRYIRTGTGNISVSSKEDLEKCLSFNRQLIGSRYIIGKYDDFDKRF